MTRPGTRTCRSAFLGCILEGRDRTIGVLEEIYGGPLSDRRPNIDRTLELRASALVPLHHRQVELIRQWRALGPEAPEAEALLSDLLVTVNAIASGLGATG